MVCGGLLDTRPFATSINSRVKMKILFCFFLLFNFSQCVENSDGFKNSGEVNNGGNVNGKHFKLYCCLFVHAYNIPKVTLKYLFCW